MLPLAWFGWIGLLASLPILFLGVGVLTHWTLRRAAGAPLTSVPPAAAPDPVWVHAHALGAFGFRVVTALHLAPRGLADQLLLELVDPARAAYAQVSAITGSGRQPVLVASAYPAGVLRTTSSSVAIPNPGEVVQAFPDAPVEVLLARHAEAQAYLAGHGFTPLPADVAATESFARRQVALEAEVVRGMGLLDVLAIGRHGRRHRQPIDSAIQECRPCSRGGGRPPVSVDVPARVA